MPSDWTKYLIGWVALISVLMWQHQKVTQQNTQIQDLQARYEQSMISAQNAALQAVVPTKADEAAATAQNAAVVAAKAAQAAAVAAVQQQVNTPTEEAPPDLILLAGHQLLTVQFADAAFPDVEATCYGTVNATAQSLLIVGRHGERRSKPNQWKNCTAAPFPPT